MQYRTTDGKSFWDLTDVCWDKLKCGCPPYHVSDWWVKWQGREWLCKRKEDSLNEILGYQIAQALDLPVQPWAAFLQTNEPGYDGHQILTGILVERWPNAQHCNIKCPVAAHFDLVARALAMLVLDRGQDPEWLTACASPKAPEGWRNPKPGGSSNGSWQDHCGDSVRNRTSFSRNGRVSSKWRSAPILMSRVHSGSPDATARKVFSSARVNCAGAPIFK